MTSIAIIEDSPQYLRVLKSIIESNVNYRCDYCYLDAESFLEEFESINVQIVIIDLQLPNMNGIELTYQVKKRMPNVNIIICSSYDDNDKIFNSLRNGANGYILKSSSPQHIISAIEEVLNGGAPMSQSIAKKVISHFYVEENQRESISLLTLKEKEVLELLSRGLLYKEIAENLGSAMETIKKHCANIYKKLQVNNRTEAINIYINNIK